MHAEFISERRSEKETRPYGEDLRAVDGILYPPPLEQQGLQGIFKMIENSTVPCKGYLRFECKSRILSSFLHIFPACSLTPCPCRIGNYKLDQIFICSKIQQLINSPQHMRSRIPHRQGRNSQYLIHIAIPLIHPFFIRMEGSQSPPNTPKFQFLPPIPVRNCP